MTRWRLVISSAAALICAVLVTTVHTAPATQGQWQTLSSPLPSNVNPIHVALMNDGMVLLVSGSGNDPTNQDLEAAVWDPQTANLVTQPVAWDMFCNGMSVLPDGRVLVNGGTLSYDPFRGTFRSSLYDPATRVFSDVADMAHGRWYPTLTTLGDGRVMTFSGLTETSATNLAVEIYTPGVGWSPEYVAEWTPPLYPRLHLLPNGTVVYTGSGTGTRTFDPSTQTWSDVLANTIYSGMRTYGSSVLLPLSPTDAYQPRVMIFGGGNPATATTEMIDLSAASPQWQAGPSMSQPRIEGNATLLPDRKVLVVGGSANDEDATTASLDADLFDPTVSPMTVTSAGSNAFPRLYHSNALLLPDARVLLVGSNPVRGSFEQQMEIYSPSYLFNADGSAATRPTVGTVAPRRIPTGGTFQVQTPDAASIRSVVVVRPGTPTHSFDNEQRLVSLSYTVANGVLNVTAPPNGNIAPPGYYLLFLLNDAGVPSVGTFVQLGADTTPSTLEMGPLTNGENHASALAPNEMHKWTLTAAAGSAIVLSVATVGDASTFTPRLELFTAAGELLAVSSGTLTAHLDVSAPATTTYAVFVERGDDTTQNGGPGNYLLTLAEAPGTFVIPAGDEGGPMTNGANHPGYIFRGDQDPWTFIAAAGEGLSLSIGELGADSPFAPWIRLFGPDGALLGEGFSQLGAKINVTAPLAGTYTVVVASGDPTYSATGSYLLTLVKPGPFVVPSNDEGGPMTNGVVYRGTITRADLDPWAFMATAGQPLAITAAKVGDSTAFVPWIRLYAPSGGLVSDSFGAGGAQINVTAPETGLYMVVVASADDTYTASGNYSLTATGIDAPPAIELGDIAVNFATNDGLWMHHNHAGPNPQWQPINQVAPTRMARGDIDGTGMVSLVATFRGQGVWIWRSASGWTQLHALDASQIITADLDGNGQDDIIVNFPGQGIWVRYNNTTWAQLHTFDATSFAAGNIAGDSNRKADLIVNFVGHGIWAYEHNAGWVQIHALDAFDIRTGDFDGNGQDDLVVNFAGQGIWILSNNATWTQLHPFNSAGIAIGDIDGDAQQRKDIIINFPDYGVYVWLNNTSWSQIHPLNASVMATVDLEEDGKDDIILNFPGYGLWLYKNNAVFEQLHPADAQDLAGGRFDIN